ncbi:nima-related protein kinase, putative [Bodo saltans]|uniref:non-specific serine/threonine protein kinase n=1 Tax=Bodo saltans TaxID=75058 RepID=A0A0S4KID9_BODSA|nr:nima-related protein kinase, putative [Bodo saltans]|eukprot:CUI14167.1 nima-related protein kinase, putative [Bodo saltans]
MHKATGSIVAIKQIDISFMGQKERIGVLAEVKVLATLAEDPHPCVMTYQESFVEQGSLWIVLEWSANGSLQDAFSSVQKKRRPEFEEDECGMCKRGMPLPLVMCTTHTRDVKMANVFLHYPEGSTMSPFGALPRVQLGDFGVSTILDDRSRALTMVGTPYYLSPELCKGMPYNTKSDVWSLGVLLYVLLNQKMPYEASNYAALILRIVQEAEAKHHPASSKFSAGLRRMATWCLQKEETQRPTARDILLHPDCMKRMMRLGLPVPQNLLEAACYRAEPLNSPTSPPAAGATAVKRKVLLPPSAGASSLPERPLPKRVGPSAPALVNKRKVRVVQGASNLAQAPHPVAKGPATPSSVGSVASSRLFSASQRTPKTPAEVPPPPGTNVLRVMSRGGPFQQASAQNAVMGTAPGAKPSMASVPKSKPREVAAVRGLPTYGEGASSEEEGGGGSSRLDRQPSSSSVLAGSTSGGTMRRLHSYERRILESDPAKANVLLRDGAGAASSPLRAGSRGATVDTHDSYRSHLRSVGDGERPPTRGMVDASAETVALLRKHELVPEGYDDAVLVGSTNTNAYVPPVQGASARVPLPSQWGSPHSASGDHNRALRNASGRTGGGPEQQKDVTWVPAQHANMTVFAQTHLSSIPDKEISSPPGADWSHRGLRLSGTAQSSVHEEAHLLLGDKDEGGYDEDGFEEEDDPVVGYVHDAYDDEGAAGIGSAFPSEERDEDQEEGTADSDGSDEDMTDYGAAPPPPPGSVVWRIDGQEGSSHHNGHSTQQTSSAAHQQPNGIDEDDTVLRKDFRASARSLGAMRRGRGDCWHSWIC